MKYLLLLLFSYTINTNYAQEASTYPGRETTDFIHLDIHNNHVIAIGSCDGIWTSKNNGADWNIEYIGRLSQHNIQIFPNQPTRALIQIDGNLSLYDMDEGIIEMYDELGTNISIKQIEVFGDEVFLYASEGIYWSNIDDIEWQLLTPVDTDLHGALGKMDVTDGLIYYTTNQGKLFKLIRSLNLSVEVANFGSRIEELSMSSDDFGVLAVSNEVKPLRTTDGWDTYTSLDEFSYGRNIVAHRDQYIMTGLGGQFELSTDGGETVTQKFLGELSSMGSIRRGFFKDENTIYLYGAGAFLASSTNEGDDWSFANPYNRDEISHLDINSSGIGYAGGTTSNIVMTEDHGITWNPYAVDSDVDGFVIGVAALENNDLVLTTNEAVYVIRDGETVNDEDFEGVRLFKDKNNQYLLFQVFLDGKYQLLRSEDGGLTWSAIFELPAIASEINQDKNGNLYMTSNNGESYYQSTDNGLSWNILPIEHSATSFTVIDGIYYSIDFNSLYRSEDEGATWEKIMQFVYGIKMPQPGPDEAIYTISGTDVTTLHRSEDNGETWERIWDFCAQPHRFVVNNQEQLVISHYDGHINVYPRPIMSNVKEGALKQKLDEVLVYPNPTMAGQEIFVKGKAEFGALIAMNGRVIKIFGEETERFELPSDLKGGTYIFRFEMDKATYHELIIIH